MEQTSLGIGTIGQRLEAARLAKGVSVSEAGQATKILSKFIEAMESDDFGVLSAPVYAKSFIRMYARYLGLDDQPLVDEYVSQHEPKGKSGMSDEVRQNLAQSDIVTAEKSPDSASLKAAVKTKGSSVFGDVNESITRLSGSRLPLKVVLPAAIVVLLLIIIASVTQCADDEVEAPAAGSAVSIEREIISGGIPDVYVVKPGEVEIAK
jgi:cytoskeletal protein RodZ